MGMTRQLRATVFFLFFPLRRGSAGRGRGSFRDVDHSDIRGSKPHNRDPSGAASDYWRGFGPKTYRIEPSRILLSVYPSTAIHAASLEFLTSEKIHVMPPAADTPSALFLLGSRWPR